MRLELLCVEVWHPKAQPTSFHASLEKAKVCVGQRYRGSGNR
jgi:hypothetical protein